MSAPKVSIIIPCYNVEKYLRECLDSVVNQTLREIQIICVDDGSTDGSLDIIQEYAAADPRIVVVTGPNGGYGKAMNKGLDRAEGTFVGIVESDDFVEPNMFEMLYEAAAANDLDVAKAGFYQYSTTPQVKNVPVRTLAEIVGGRVFCPMTGFRRLDKKVAFFKVMPSIWAGIYRREFIRQNNIRFNPTPGASYQDVGFCFKVWARAKRVQVLNACLLHYRVDNSQSSVHNPGKVYCICDEYAELDRFLSERPADRNEAMPLMIRIKYENYLWNYERLCESLRKEFLGRFCKEFLQHREDGLLRRVYFSWYDWDDLQQLLLDPDRYHEIQSAKLRGEAAPGFYDSYPEQRPVKPKCLYYFVRKAAGAGKYLQDAGISETAKIFAEKVRRKLSGGGIKR